MLKNKKIFKKKYLILLIVIVVAVGAVSYFVFFKDSSNKTGDNESNEVGIADQNINMDPATEAEKAESQQAKDRISQQNSTNNSSGKKQVKPTITYVAQEGQTVNIQSYVGGVVEEGGTCTAEFTRGSSKFTVQSKGFANVGNTNCEPLFVEVGKFNSKGAWSVVISYESNSSSGKSEAKEFNVN